MGVVETQELTKEMVVRYDTTPEELIDYSKDLCDRSCAECCSASTNILEEEVDKIKASGKYTAEELAMRLSKNITYSGTEFYIPKKIKEACAFLEIDKEESTYSCGLQDVKPLACATYSCEHGNSVVAWFYLNYLTPLEDIIEHNDIRSLMELGELLGSGREKRLVLSREHYDALEFLAEGWINISGMFKPEE